MQLDARTAIEVAVVDSLLLVGGVGAWLLGWIVAAIVLFGLSFVGTPLVLVALMLHRRA